MKTKATLSFLTMVAFCLTVTTAIADLSGVRNLRFYQVDIRQKLKAKLTYPLIALLILSLVSIAHAEPQSPNPPEFAWELVQEGHGPVHDLADAVASYGEYSYIVGRMGGAISEPTTDSKHPRGYVRKLDLYGDEVWTVPVDPENITFPDGGVRVSTTSVYGVATDASGVYITGPSTNPFEGPLTAHVTSFVRKLDHDGNLLWTQQIPHAVAHAIAVHDGRVYVSGVAQAKDLSGASTVYNIKVSAFLRSYSIDGVEDWTKQVISICDQSNDRLCRITEAYAVAADSTGVYMGGTTWGSLIPRRHAGHWDGWVMKYDHSGNELWRDQFGDDEWDSTYGIATDGEHLVVVGKETQRVVTPGCNLSRPWVGIIRTYDTDGNLQLVTNLPKTQEGYAFFDYQNTSFGNCAVFSQLLGVTLTETGPAVVGSLGIIYIDGDRDGIIQRYDWNGERLLNLEILHSGQEFTGSLSDQHFSVHGLGGESLFGVATVQGNLVVAGGTMGFVEGGEDTLGSRFGGKSDALAMRVLEDGSTDWVHQFGTLHPTLDSRSDILSPSIVSDTKDGVYTAFRNEGVVPGERRTSKDQIHLSHYDSEGNLSWIRQIGLSPPASSALLVGISADKRGVYVLWNGFPNYGDGQPHRQGILSRYSSEGTLLWEQYLVGVGTQSIFLKGIATHRSTTFITGSGTVNEDGIVHTGIFIKAYDDEGLLLWTQWSDTSDGTGIDFPSINVRGMAADKNGVYLAGHYNSGGSTPHLVKLGLDGVVQWIIDIEGLDTTDFFVFIELEAHKNEIYVLGKTREILDGDEIINFRGQDFFIRSYKSDGSAGWTKQIGVKKATMSANKKGVALLSGFGSTHRDEGLLIEDGNNVVRQFDKDGDAKWTMQYGEHLNLNIYVPREFGHAIASESDKTFFVLGRKDVSIEGNGVGSLLSVKKLEVRD